MELLSTASPFASFSGLRQSDPRRRLSSVAGGQQCRHFTVLAEQYNRRQNRKLKHARIRTKVEGTPERPRLAVFRSNQHMYCQVIDDTKMHTLAAMSTIQKPLRDELDLTSGPTIEAAKRIGEEIAKLCLRKGISKVTFDRGGFEYHGRIKALAESAREHGLDF